MSKVDRLKRWWSHRQINRWIFLFAAIVFFARWRSTLGHNGYFIDREVVLFSTLAGAVAGILLCRPGFVRRGIGVVAATVLLLIAFLTLITRLNH